MKFTAKSAASRLLESVAVSQRRLIRLLIALILCGITTSLLFYFGLAHRYSLAQFGDLPRQTIGTLNQYSNDGALLFILTFVLLFACYGLGYVIIRRASGRQFLIILVGFGLIFNLILVWMYPADASDIYDYIIRGRMSSVYGLNPLKDVPSQVKQDPFYAFATWHNVPSAYGPAWEVLAHLASKIAGDDRTTNVITFKALGIAGYFLASLFVGLALNKIAPRRLLTGVYLLMWNPLLLYMTAGTGHHDALTAAAITLALYALTRRWYVASTLGLVLGTLLKFIPLLILPIIALVALRQLRGWLRLRYLIVSAILSMLLATAAYAPYWHGLETFRFERRDRMYTGSVATVIRELLLPILDNKPVDAKPADTPITNALIANGTLIIFGVFYLWQVVVLLRDDPQDMLLPIRIMGRILLFYLVVVSIWFFGWYLIWMLPVVILLEDTPLRRVALRFSYLVTWQSFLYNYMVVMTKGNLWIPWLDLTPAALYMGYVWGYTAYYQVTLWLRRININPLNVSVGVQLQQARLTTGLTRNQLSDEVDLPFDVIEQYEQGERAVNLDDAYKLAQRLGLSLTDWLTPKV